MRILIRLPNWVGDTLLSLPALTALIRKTDNEYLFSGTALPLELTAHLRQNSESIRLGKGGAAGLDAWGEIRCYRRLRPQRALLFTPAFSAAFRVWAAGIPLRTGWAEQGRCLFLNESIQRSPRGTVHIVEEFNQLATQAGAEWFPPAPFLPVSETAATRARQYLHNHPAGMDQPLVALCPGANYGSAKQWPASNFAQLRADLEKRGIGGVVLGSPGEKSLCDSILSGAGPDWISAAGVGSIDFAGELMRLMNLAVCNDTGTMHLAAAVGTPLVALFGSTEPHWTAPVSVAATVLRESFDCSPCFCKQCPKDDPAPCLAAIRPESVSEAVLTQLENEPPAGRPALFIDRDGTLCELVPYLHRAEQAKLIDGAAAAIRTARAAGYRIVVITNQSGIARGYFRHEDFEKVNRKLVDDLSRQGATIDRFYYCPHHPDFDQNCRCRKPQPGMLQQAALELRLDLGRSLMVGDTIEDLIAGCRAGAESILVKTGYGAEQVLSRVDEIPEGTAVVADLGAAVAARVPLTI